MKILLVHNNASVTGGADVFFRETQRVLVDKGHDVATFTCFDDSDDLDFPELSPVIKNYDEGSFFEKAVRVPSIIFNRDTYAKIRFVLREFRPDVVHAFAVYGRLSPSVLKGAKDMGIPIVLSCNDYKHLCPNYKLFQGGQICEECKGGRFYRAAVNKCIHDSYFISAVGALEAYVHQAMDIWRRNVDVFLFASRFMERKTLDWWRDVEIKSSIVRNPFNVEHNTVPMNVGDYFLFFGRLVEEKGVDVIISVAKMNPSIPFVVVGDGPQCSDLKSKVAGFTNIKFVGAAWDKGLASWLNGARAVIVPSLWHENFPYVILQAFAAGKAVIGARRGGIPELLVNERHGWLFDPADVESLHQRIKEVCSISDADLLALGALVREYVSSEFSDDAFYSDLVQAYRVAIA